MLKDIGEIVNGQIRKSLGPTRDFVRRRRNGKISTTKFGDQREI